MLKNLFVVAVLAVTLGVGGFLSTNSAVYADGNGSPTACLDTTEGVLGSEEGTDDLVVVDVGAGNVAEGVCIKSGENMFNGNQHSQVLGNGTYENGCYQVSGVGTQEVTVARLKGGSDCQGISHIDVLVGEADGEDPEEPEEPEVPVEPRDNTPEVPAETAEAQVDAPVAGVSAGGGVVLASVAGLIGSISAASYGVLRLKRQS